MDKDVGNARLPRGIRKRDHMEVVAVNATVGNQSEEMKSMTAGPSEGFPQYSVSGQFAIRDCLVNPRQVLIDDPAGSQVKMADFRIAHLSIRQADVSPARTQSGIWIIPVELVVKRRPRQKRCICIFLSLFSTARVNAPAIANNEHNRTSHTPGHF